MGPGLWGLGVARLDQLANLPPRLVRRHVLSSQGRHLFRQLRILDRLTQPMGDIALLEVVTPGGLVDAVGDLEEDPEVLRAQIQLPVWPAEVEGSVGGKFPVRVLPAMPPALLARDDTANPPWPLPARGAPREALPVRQIVRRHRRGRQLAGHGELPEGLVWRLADRDCDVDR